MQTCLKQKIIGSLDISLQAHFNIMHILNHIPSGWMKTEQMASPYWFLAVQVYSPSSPGPIWLMRRDTLPLLSSYFILYLLDSKHTMHTKNFTYIDKLKPIQPFIITEIHFQCRMHISFQGLTKYQYLKCKALFNPKILK